MPGGTFSRIVATKRGIVPGRRRRLLLTLVEIERRIQRGLPRQQFLQPRFVLERQQAANAPRASTSAAASSRAPLPENTRVPTLMQNSSPA